MGSISFLHCSGLYKTLVKNSKPTRTSASPFTVKAFSLTWTLSNFKFGKRYFRGKKESVCIGLIVESQAYNQYLSVTYLFFEVANSIFICICEKVENIVFDVVLLQMVHQVSSITLCEMWENKDSLKPLGTANIRHCEPTVIINLFTKCSASSISCFKNFVINDLVRCTPDLIVFSLVGISL